MNESPAMMERALTLAGTVMSFDGFEIKGIVGFNLSMLYKGEQTLYGTETQNFSFQTTTTNVVNFDLAEDNLFTVTESGKTYRFKISRTPVDDITGWSEIHCDHIGEVSV